MLRVLLVEDHPDIAANIYEGFEQQAHLIDYASNAEQALRLLESNRFDVLILDVMLPGMDGIELCRHIKAHRLSAAMVLMLTARDQVDDKLAAFDAGADDYLTKPFSMRELLARSVVLSRRRRVDDEAVLTVGDLTLNIHTREVIREDQSVVVTKTGFKILSELLRVSPAVVLRDDLEHLLWGDARPESDALRTHIASLRAAVDKPFDHALLHTVHGAGWKLQE